MAININKELSSISITLTKAFQDEIRRQGLVDSGALLNSINVRPIQTPRGFTLKFEALDYFQYLDDKYKITQNVFDGSEFKDIEKQLVDLYSLIIEDELDIK